MALPIQHPERLPLESGDRLSREEFHRRYEQCPEIKKAELIDGVVYVGGRRRPRDRPRCGDTEEHLARALLGVIAPIG